MSEGLERLKRRIDSAADLHAVVRTMKALAAVNIRQYEDAVRSLAEYASAVQEGLHAVLLDAPRRRPPREIRDTVLAVFGSDQGMVGQFNDAILDRAHAERPRPARRQNRVVLWAVGSRAAAGMSERFGTIDAAFPLPPSARALAPAVSGLILRFEELRRRHGELRLLVFHNAPRAGASYSQRRALLYPPDEEWLRRIARRPWPRRGRPMFLEAPEELLAALVGEHLFVSLHRAFAASMAAENAARLAAMQRAEKKVDEMRDELTAAYHAARQAAITEELFDVVAGFEALTGGPGNPEGAPASRS